MTVIVRALRAADPVDTEAFVEVRRRALPFMVSTPESLLHDVTHAAPEAHYRQLVAEADGEVIGTLQMGIAHDSPVPGQGYLNVYVHPDHLHRGAGGLLARTAVERLTAAGARRLLTWVLDTPENRAFAERRGYTPGRSAHFLRLNLAHGTLPPLADPPPGVELRTAADFADDPRPLFDLDAEVSADEPGDLDAQFDDYPRWIAETYRHPLLDHALSTVVVVDGAPVAFTAVRTDGRDRYFTGMTGTARAFRGRGLAKLAKNASLHRARAAGCTEAFTGNDTGNGPMLAVNTWFGYEVCATEVRYVRELG
ncbi:GNAT family N-acetyltransferase [Streptomyces scabiei]|uniref:GNAT family N-acetyltransferase n=1 Tax=Streptomyces TaxID=1883 RepID=UPI00030387DF|nr:MULTISPECIES: GNAT family N-acetyltransferase [Streptomyces]MDX2578554.1 GNAT family N-acetyltransferase [Streptomyces scabiei]MDX2626133.1 GNAT family N-acetyltransferase [Streptomyces scabiei]MDX2656284.1 GNAT family N-acetyltransferase [Streptomyces scabiei]MDX2724993.1 GNAT family N-acetyltransferase [Streptomyces scabiei]MDX2870388.1 GNAT family N-acetyltransferase [Streptomyces scabiei]